MGGASRFVPLRGDRWLAAVLVALSQVEVWGYGVAGGSLAAALCLGAAGAIVGWRRRAPILSAALVLAAITTCALVAGEPFSATSVITVTVGFFTIGGMARRRRAVAALGGAMVLGLFETHPLDLNMYLSITFTSFVVPWLLGLLWARRHAAREAAHAQAAAAEAAVAAERLRLAQELHDVVSHNVGMIAVQAGAADVLLAKEPDRTRESLQVIEAGARETLLELRRMLGLIREGDPDPRASAPSLRQVDRIVEAASSAGVAVELRTDGERRDLEPSVELAAYRIVQEALTNVVAHAGPCRVTITLDYRDDSLVIEISDDGRPPGGTAGGGYGLVGLRERVAALGGTFEAGPRSGGGFCVRALLPQVTS